MHLPRCADVLRCLQTLSMPKAGEGLAEIAPSGVPTPVTLPSLKV